MLKIKQKLLKDYGNPRNNMAAKEFRADLAALIHAVREEAARVAENVADTAGVGKEIAATIRRK